MWVGLCGVFLTTCVWCPLRGAIHVIPTTTYAISILRKAVLCIPQEGPATSDRDF